MSSTSPAAEERRENEDAFSAQLREAESHGVKSILANDASSMAIFRILDSASGLAEMAYENARASNTRPVACKAGCSWCCYQTVGVTAPEAIRIARHLRAMKDAGAREAMLEKLRSVNEAARGTTAEARDKLQMPCAFLIDGRCGIYPVRPLACVEYTSFDVEDCVKDYHSGYATTTARCDRARSLVYKAVRTGMEDGLSGALPESDTAPLELSAAVADALSSPDPAAEWMAGKPVFERAHLIKELG
ncbi:MAG TPA: YkgJ family cysteine cluster protein [Acidobacteriaceae bacterium]|jgi:Fe-S-cluster containining protein|nr:YkgJ family cysteine cluster protein [Acidobacteriaceae bacterium]